MMYLHSTLLHVFRKGHKERHPIAGGSSSGSVPISGASNHRKQSTTETWLTTSSTTAGPTTAEIGSDKQIEYELRARENFFESWIFYKICAVKSYDFFIFKYLCKIFGRNKTLLWIIPFIPTYIIYHKFNVY